MFKLRELMLNKLSRTNPIQTFLLDLPFICSTQAEANVLNVIRSNDPLQSLGFETSQVPFFF